MKHPFNEKSRGSGSPGHVAFTTTLPGQSAMLARHGSSNQDPSRSSIRTWQRADAADRDCQRHRVDGADRRRQRADVRLYPGQARCRRLRSDLGRAHHNRPVSRRPRRLYPDRTPGAPGRPRPCLHGAVGADRAGQCSRRRRTASDFVDRCPRSVRLCHMRPVHRRAELAERCRRQCHTRPGDGLSSTSPMSLGLASATPRWRWSISKRRMRR